MGKVIEKDSFVGGQQYLFLNGLPIPNVQNFNISYRVPYTNTPFLGEQDSYPIHEGSSESQVTVNTINLSQDNLINFTGNSPINGYLINDLQYQDNGAICLVSGYLSSYTNSYSVNSLPTINTQFIFYRKAGQLNTQLDNSLIPEVNSLSFSSSGILKENQLGGALLSMPNVESCPILSYNLNISTPRTVIYPINKRYPSHVFMSASAGVSLSLEIERSVYELFSSDGYPTTKPIVDIDIDLVDKDGQSYNTYRLKDMILDSSSLNVANSVNDTISLVYRRKL